MVQPPGFLSEQNTSEVCRLKKSLDELKQAVQAWKVKIMQQLRKMGLLPQTCMDASELEGGSESESELDR